MGAEKFHFMLFPLEQKRVRVWGQDEKGDLPFKDQNIGIKYGTLGTLEAFCKENGINFQDVIIIRGDVAKPAGVTIRCSVEDEDPCNNEILSDEVGMYAVASCWIIRPIYKTRFDVGDMVPTYYYPQSVIAGVGIHHARRFAEFWVTTGIAKGELEHFTPEQIKRRFAWYKDHALKCHKRFSSIHLTDEELQLAREYANEQRWDVGLDDLTEGLL